jgi:hypothetical protein
VKDVLPWLVIGFLVFLGGCAGVNELERPAQDLSAAAFELSGAERKVLADLNEAIAGSYRHRGQADYLAGKPVDASLEEALHPPLLPQPSIDIRLKAVQAVELYSQSLLALTAGIEKGKVDSNTEASARSISQVLPSSVPPAEVAGVTAALSAIANLLVDRARYRTAEALATAAQPHLETLAALIKNDDEFITVPLDAAAMFDAAAVAQILEHVRADKGVTEDRLLSAFLSVTASERVVQLAAEQGAVEALADAVVRANSALSNGQRQAFQALAREALARGEDAGGVFKAVSPQ